MPTVEVIEVAPTPEEAPVQYKWVQKDDNGDVVAEGSETYEYEADAKVVGERILHEAEEAAAEDPAPDA